MIVWERGKGMVWKGMFVGREEDEGMKIDVLCVVLHYFCILVLIRKRCV